MSLTWTHRINPKTPKTALEQLVESPRQVNLQVWQSLPPDQKAALDEFEQFLQSVARESVYKCCYAHEVLKYEPFKTIPREGDPLSTRLESLQSALSFVLPGVKMRIDNAIHMALFCTATREWSSSGLFASVLSLGYKAKWTQQALDAFEAEGLPTHLPFEDSLRALFGWFNRRDTIPFTRAQCDLIHIVALYARCEYLDRIDPKQWGKIITVPYWNLTWRTTTEEERREARLHPNATRQPLIAKFFPPSKASAARQTELRACPGYIMDPLNGEWLVEPASLRGKLTGYTLATPTFALYPLPEDDDGEEFSSMDSDDVDEAVREVNQEEWDNLYELGLDFIDDGDGDDDSDNGDRQWFYDLMEESGDSKEGAQLRKELEIEKERRRAVKRKREEMAAM